jgi:hypothetical protein
MSADLSRRLLAEAIGTGIFVMLGAGSVVAALGGGELDHAGRGMVAITFGLVVALAIYGFAYTSSSWRRGRRGPSRGGATRWSSRRRSPRRDPREASGSEPLNTTQREERYG